MQRFKFTERKRELIQRQDLPATLPSNTFSVYTLTDPRDDGIRYVGVTQRPRVRLVRHATRPHSHGQLWAWIAELDAVGQVPIMRIVEAITGSKEQAREREKIWIERLTADGIPLLNLEALHLRRETRVDGQTARDYVAARKQRLEEFTRRPILFPRQQNTVTLYGHSVVAVLLPDGRSGLVLNDLCDAIGLNPKSQFDRIRDDDLLCSHLLLVRIATAGGPQTMNVLSDWALPLWLFGIRLKFVEPTIRASILMQKRKAADVLYRYFSRQSLSRPQRPTPDASRTAWIEYNQQMAAWLQWLDDSGQ